MSDLQRYIKKRKVVDKAFAKNYEENYVDFEFSIILKQLREDAGLSQEELAKRMSTKKSAISRIENKAYDIRLSTLFKFAAVLGKHVHIRIT